MITPPSHFFRKSDSHKASKGRLLVLAGSWGYAGAGLLCAQAAVVAGCGYVIWKVPGRLYPVVAGNFLDGVVHPLEDDSIGYYVPRHIEEILEGEFSAVVAGPGWGQHEKTGIFLQELIQRYQGPLLLDADALNLLVGKLEILKTRKGESILTPHPGEAARLLGCTVEELQQNREKACKELYSLTSSTIILKGKGTLVASNDKFWKNEYDSATLATAGSGDVLSGMSAALLAAGIGAYEASTFAVAWHGLAGQYLEKRIGPQGKGASALFEALLEIQKEMYGENTSGQ